MRPVPSRNMRKQIAPLPLTVSAYPAIVTSEPTMEEPFCETCPMVWVRYDVGSHDVLSRMPLGTGPCYQRCSFLFGSSHLGRY